MKLLIVDDDRTLRTAMRRALESDSVQVLEADDGVTALQKLVDEPVDMVLLDLTLRTMDGLETLQAIRRSPRFSKLQVVLITGHADERYVRQAMALGISGFLVKPFTLAALRERIRGFQRSPAPTTQAAPPPRASVESGVARAVVDLADEGLSRWIGEAFSRHDSPPSSPAEMRWLVVTVEMRGEHETWELRMRVQWALASRIGTARHGGVNVSDAQAMTAVGHVVESIAEALRPTLFASDPSSRTFHAGVAIAAGADVTSGTPAFRRWLTTSQQQVVAIELATAGAREPAAAHS